MTVSAEPVAPFPVAPPELAGLAATLPEAPPVLDAVLVPLLEHAAATSVTLTAATEVSQARR